jgi:MoxR-like ATPase
MSQDQPALTGDDYRVLGEIGEAHKAIRAELAKRIVGQEEVIEQVLTAFFAGGHVLLLGVPGLAKTLLISSLAEILGMDFNRIQFTPDLMPSDITGSDVLSGDDTQRSFQFMGGPIFANFVLADEINRTPPKTQAALLEAMEEFSVTVAGKRYPLPEPYFVMATQNPIEQEGTYLLPAAALDRFMFTVLVDYPTQHNEMEMLYQTTSRDMPPVETLFTAEKIVRMLDVVRRVNLRDDTLKYAIDLVRASRPENKFNADVSDLVECGGSPRATQALILGAKAKAALEGRDEALPDDIRAIALPAMHHRILTNFHAEADGVNSRDIVRLLLHDVPRPEWDVEPATPTEHRGIWEVVRDLILGKPRKRSVASRDGSPKASSTGANRTFGPAEPGARFLAYLIDALLSLLIGLPALLFRFFLLSEGRLQGPLVFVGVVLSLLTLGGIYYYFVAAVSRNGGTYGMTMRDISVVDENGNRLTQGRAFVRHLCFVMSLQCLGPLGLLTMLFRQDRRTLWDLISGTYVVRGEVQAARGDHTRRLQPSQA